MAMLVALDLKIAGLFQAAGHAPDNNDKADDEPDLEVEPTGSTPELHYTPHQPSTCIGRIRRARSVPPPHTVLSLKCCLAHAEDVSDPGGVKTSLYPHPGTQSAMSAMSNGSKIVITAMSNGWTPKTVLALVLPEEHLPQPDFPVTKGGSGIGEVTSKTSFDADDPALGRVEHAHILSPHEAASIKRCIARLEENPIYTWVELYREVSADVAMPEGSPVPLGRGFESLRGESSNLDLPSSATKIRASRRIHPRDYLTPSHPPDLRSRPPDLRHPSHLTALPPLDILSLSERRVFAIYHQALRVRVFRSPGRAPPPAAETGTRAARLLKNRTLLMRCLSDASSVARYPSAGSPAPGNEWIRESSFIYKGTRLTRSYRSYVSIPRYLRIRTVTRSGFIELKRN
ncbi:hypothetical protein C8R43DRAFT_1139045 [Mycena crocata]|nr:hypothetical protein C8R43DRAFT_1139045 [Mycena crocata]